MNGTYDILIQLQDRKEIEHESTACELYSEERLHMSNSEGGSGSLFMAVKNHAGNEGISVRLCACVWVRACVCMCVCVRVCVCGRVHPRVWLTFSLARYQWVMEANRRWRLRRQTNYQQVIGSTPARPIHAFVSVRRCVCVCARACVRAFRVGRVKLVALTFTKLIH